MTSMKADITWLGNLAFEASNRGHKSRIDVSREMGGEDSAATPKEILLNSIATCSGIDVVMIAQKMRLTIGKLDIKVEAQKTQTIPSYFSQVHLEYHLEGDFPSEKMIKAVVLSMTKYCGVSYMISRVCPITYDVFINGKLAHQDKADFTIEGLP